MPGSHSAGGASSEPSALDLPSMALAPPGLAVGPLIPNEVEPSGG